MRHESPAYLERLKDVPLVLELPLATPLKLDFHWSRASCLQDPQLGTKPAARQILEPGTRVALFVSCAAPPAVAEPGDTLVGTLTLTLTLTLPLTLSLTLTLTLPLPLTLTLAQVGSATYAKLSAEAVGAGKRPGGWPVTLVVPPAC